MLKYILTALAALTLILISLQLIGVTGFSWWWVFAPTLAGVAGVVCAIVWGAIDKLFYGDLP
jgi:energy-converting hydrogenase Eha subunit A